MLEAESSPILVHGGVPRCSSTNSADTLDTAELACKCDFGMLEAESSPIQHNGGVQKGKKNEEEPPPCLPHTFRHLLPYGE